MVSPREVSGNTSVRTCVGCRRKGLRNELLRVVAAQGQVVVDERRRLPGRGAWLHPVRECLALAIRRKALPRALRVSGRLDTGDLEAYLEGHTRGSADKDTDNRVVPS